jgi:aminopeptidase N
MFDALSYDKGASVIRMLEGFLGADAFQRGLQLYLSRMQYRNAVTMDLWNALEESSGQPVGAIMSSWTTFPGFPVVTVGDGGELSQHRFLVNGRDCVDGHLWRCVSQ